MSTEQVSEYIIAVGSAKSLKDRTKHTDEDCQYIQESNTRPYRESDPELPVCKGCEGTVAEGRKDPDYSYYRMASGMNDD